MAPSLPVSAQVSAPATERTAVESAYVPWYIWCAVTAITSTTIGLYWDVSWHISIGRDTFWTPAHMAVYFCGVLAGISCGYLILSTTFRNHPDARATPVNMWGFRGPLGAFICTWGGVAMITSAPFDNWWHNAYGLDVKILSPPHALLITGMLVVGLGALMLILGDMNRGPAKLRRKLEQLFLYVGALMVVLFLIFIWEYIERWFMHSARCYVAVSIAIPVLLAGLSRASARRWASTTVIAIYTALLLAAEWIVPLFPAEPKLGPVYQNVHHFVPMDFPLLLLVPALVLDLVWQRASGWNKWAQAALAGAAFLVTFGAVQWPFADFLLAPGARNRIFGGDYLGYNWYFGSPGGAYRFWPMEETRSGFWLGMVAALLSAVLSTRIGLAWGDWMRRIRR